jgi:Fe2+ transport system protein FeoA
LEKPVQTDCCLEILMLQNYGQGPLVVNVRGTRVALGRGEAAKIHIKKVE